MAGDGLFFGVAYTILLSDKLDGELAKQLRSDLQDQGATYIPLSSSGRIENVHACSHIISTHVEFPEYAAALDANCNVVKPSWVEQSIAKGRQAQPRSHSPDPALIFQDVVITCADLPQGDRDAITAGVMALGGMYSSPLTKLVTHIVSLSEEHDKVRIVKEKNLKCSVVLPHWFDDCLKLGRRITEKPYLLPNPEILDHDLRMEKPSSDFNAPDLKGATSAVAGLPPPIKRDNFKAFADKKVFFAKDLNIHDRLARTLQELVEHGEGTRTENIDECDTYIGHYRDGADYVKASRAGKEVGNLAWFYDVVVQQRWTNPLSKLLHYPIPRNGIPGFEGFRISISNYTGDARIFLENVINEAGANFTKTMKVENTHLITAHKGSEKCDAAEEWNINIINHLWLEESYAKCEVQSLTNLRYTHFPPRTHLGEIVGQTPIDIDRVREVYFKEEEHVDGGEGEGENEDGDIVMKDAEGHPAKVSPKKNGKAALKTNGVPHEEDDHDDATDEDEEDETTEPVAVPKTVKKRAPRTTDHGTPEIDRKVSGKENEAPPSTGRASKLKAQQQLDMAKADIALFEKEMKRKGGVVHGRKRHSDEASNDGDSTDRSAATRATKRTKSAATSTVSVVPIQYKMMVSGDERWLNNESKEEEDKKTLRSLGIQLTANPAECTLLCAPRLLRTRKFICALARGPEVVTISYLDAALTNKILPDPSKHTLRDTDTEKKLNLRLDDSLQRARDNNQKLLRGWTIYVTESVNGGFDTYKDIVDINGGLALPYRGRTGIQLPRRRLKVLEDPDAGLESQNQGGDGETDFVYLVSGTADEEVKHWATFRKMAEKQGLSARIVKTDWLLNCAMAQRVEWDARWELDEKNVGKK